MLIVDGEQRNYTAIKSLSRLLASSSSEHKCKRHFCMNCLQGFPPEISRDKHFEYCKDNETVRIKMPKEGSLVKFQKHFLSQLKDLLPTQKNRTPKKSKHISSGFCVYNKFACRKVENPLKLYRGEDCVEVFCIYVSNEARRLYYMFLESR